MNKFFLLFYIVFSFSGISGQSSPFSESDYDDAVLFTGAGLLLYYIATEPGGNTLTSDEIFSLNRIEVNSFDRSATFNWNPSAARWSDHVQHLVFAAPLSIFLSENIRSDFKIVSVMLGQSFLLNQGLSGFLKLKTARKRPYLYNENAPIGLKYRRQVFYSFVSSHTSATAAVSFTTARIFSAYYPDSPWKKFVWAGAFTLPAITGLLRYEAGRHYPTDVIGGYILGAAIGWLIPELHRVKHENSNWTVTWQNSTIGLKIEF